MPSEKKHGANYHSSTSKSSLTPTWIGVGSNLDRPKERVLAGINQLSRYDGLRLTDVSTLFLTEPDGPPQPDYVNAVARFETTLSPREVLIACQRVESLHSRKRAVRWGARTLDLDVLMWGSRVIQTDTLTVPHPRMHLRRFVLEPFASISPHALHPVLGVTIEDCLAGLDD